MRPISRRPLLLAGLLSLAACRGAERAPASDSARAPAPAPAPAAPARPRYVPPSERPRSPDLRLELDVDARRLHLWRGDERLHTYRVAVGTPEWPTKRGQFYVQQVVWNPEWHPPRDESWARTRKHARPGDPENPLGVAQIVYDPPRTLHGTNAPQSVGRAASHGSVRMLNEDIVRLGRFLQQETGATRSDAWYARVQSERSRKAIVDLPLVVPILVR